MGNNQPASLNTDLSKLRAAGRELASLSVVQGLLRIAPGLPTAALAGLAVMFLAWSCEHQTRRREAAQATQAKKQAGEEISRLQEQAAGAVRDAKQSTQAAQELETQRQQLAREAEGLRQSLESLRKQELARTNEVATLPTEEVASRVASRLGEQGTGNREQGTGPQEQGTGNRGLGTGPQEQGTGDGEQGTGQQPGGALMLSEPGARKVETTFVELDSCRQQAQVLGQQVSNCEQQAKLDTALQQQQASTISQLQAALADKDQLLKRSDEEHRAELKALHGSWRTRFYHAVEIFAGGFLAGVVVR
jgi:DNA anti-recombination protein RmuC